MKVVTPVGLQPKHQKECLIYKQHLIVMVVGKYGGHWTYKLYQKQDLKINYIK